MSVLAAGCGGAVGSAPTVLPPASVPGPSSSTDATVGLPPPSSTPVASAVAAGVVPKPAEADAATSEGAAAFVRYYINVINDAIQRNDVSLLSTLSAPECGGCQNYIKSVQDLAAQHGHVDRGGIVVTNAVAPALQGGSTVVLLNFGSTEYVARSSKGDVLTRLAANAGLVAELSCERRGTTWVIKSFDAIVPPT